MSKKLHSFTVWRGPSELDGKPIALLVTRGYTANKKTGGMIQTYILRTGFSPTEILRRGEDGSICGECIHSSRGNGGLGSCYVRVDTRPLQVWKAYKRGKYPKIPLKQASLQVTGVKVRLGTYGDPAAIPETVWSSFLSHVQGVTGYTHLWRDTRMAWLKNYTMASCDNPTEAREAQAQGWRTFTITTKDAHESRQGTTPVAHSYLCPASEEGGRKLTCSECMACDGLHTGRTASVYIPVHGVQFKQNRFTSLIRIGR